MIVGIHGKAGAGKSTVANALVEELGYSVWSFALPLKRILCDIFGWDIDAWKDSEWKESPNERAYLRTPRELAQTLGTEWGRHSVNRDFWVDKAMAAIPHGPNLIVFDDVRFENEINAIRNRGGAILHVVRNDVPTLTKLVNHVSEKDLGELCDCKISAGDGELELLREVAVSMVETYSRGDVPRYNPERILQ